MRPRYEDISEPYYASSVKSASLALVYHPLVPCHQRRQGEIVKDMESKLTGFVISSHRQLEQLNWHLHLTEISF
jgi:hypothetical protein